MKVFHIVTNFTKDGAAETTEYIRNYLEQRGCICKDRATEDVECVIVLGGDGTLLRAAGDHVDKHVPLIGINLGTLGYLAGVDKDDIEEALDKLIDNQFEIEGRMMITGMARIRGEHLKPMYALNDIVINRKGSLHAISFNINVNGQFLSTYDADGLILSTPTGSTAYNLSAGGPIVEPRAKLMVLTPVCTHNMMNSRSIVLADNDIIDITIGECKDGTEQEVEASFDGRFPVTLQTGDSIRIIRSDKVTKIVKLSRESFLEILHKKMSGK